MGRECVGMESFFKSKSKKKLKGRSNKNKNGKLTTTYIEISVRPCSFSL